jgi:hypothetical protein
MARNPPSPQTPLGEFQETKPDGKVVLPHEQPPLPGEPNPTGTPLPPDVDEETLDRPHTDLTLDEDQTGIQADPEEHDRNHEEALHFLRIAADRIRAIPEGVAHGLGAVLKGIEKALGDE